MLDKRESDPSEFEFEAMEDAQEMLEDLPVFDDSFDIYEGGFEVSDLEGYIRQDANPDNVDTDNAVICGNQSCKCTVEEHQGYWKPVRKRTGSKSLLKLNWSLRGGKWSHPHNPFGIWIETTFDKNGEPRLWACWNIRVIICDEHKAQYLARTNSTNTTSRGTADLTSTHHPSMSYGQSLEVPPSDEGELTFKRQMASWSSNTQQYSARQREVLLSNRYESH